MEILFWVIEPSHGEIHINTILLEKWNNLWDPLPLNNASKQIGNYLKLIQFHEIPSDLIILMAKSGASVRPENLPLPC